jgi:hypothetical protein
MRRSGAAFFCLMLMAGHAAAEALNVDFGDQGSATELLGPGFAGAAGQAGAWNTITAAGPTPLAGLDGLPTDVVLTLAPDEPVLNPDGSSAALTGDLKLLMADFFFENASDAFWSVTLTGIDPGLYDLYVYAPANLSSLIATGTFTINGVSMNDLPGSANSAFLLGTNYAVLSGLAVQNGTLTLQSTEASTRYLGLSGLQLVPVTAVPSLNAWGGMALVAALLAAGRGLSRRTSSPGVVDERFTPRSEPCRTAGA